MRHVALAVALTLASGGIVSAQTAPPPAAAAAPQGFLSAAALQTIADAVPPPPADGSAEAQADIAGSDRMKALEDSDRWLLATRHAELRAPLAISHFDCVLGARLTADNSPRLIDLLSRVMTDANAAAELAKARAFRPRPVGVDAERRPCQVVSPAGRASPSYPSGSASVGAAYGEAFAVLAPDVADAAHEMGRQIGLSRLICAMHYPTDVREGMKVGQAVFNAETASPDFAPMLEAARAELAANRARGETSPACAAERAALATPLSL